MENCHHVETYAELMPNDADVTERILYTFYNHNIKRLENGDIFPRNGFDDSEEYARNQDTYDKAKKQAPGVMQMLRNTTVIDLGKVIKGLIDGDSLDTSEKSFEKLAVYDENGNTTASYVEQLGAHVALAQILKGTYVHPTQAGHDAEAPLLIAAMKEKRIDPYAIAYHRLAAPMEQTVKVLDTCSTVDDLIEWTEEVKEIWGGENIEQEIEAPSVPEKLGAVFLNLIRTLLITFRALLARLTAWG